MKLIMSIINSDSQRILLDAMARNGFSATVISTTGGFLRLGNTTLFCGVADDRVQNLLDVIRDTCPSRTQYVTPLPPVMEPGEVNIPMPVEKQVGGATVFVMNIEHFEKI